VTAAPAEVIEQAAPGPVSADAEGPPMLFWGGAALAGGGVLLGTATLALGIIAYAGFAFGHHAGLDQETRKSLDVVGTAAGVSLMLATLPVAGGVALMLIDGLAAE